SAVRGLVGGGGGDLLLVQRATQQSTPRGRSGAESQRRTSLIAGRRGNQLCREPQCADWRIHRPTDIRKSRARKLRADFDAQGREQRRAWTQQSARGRHINRIVSGKMTSDDLEEQQ